MLLVEGKREDCSWKAKEVKQEMDAPGGLVKHGGRALSSMSSIASLRKRWGGKTPQSIAQCCI